MEKIEVVRDAEEIAALPPETRAVKGDGLRDEDLLGLHDLKALEAVYLDGCFDLSDAALEVLSGLPALTKLYLSGNHVTDEGFRHLSRCGGLVELGLDTRCTGSGFAHLAGLPALREVHLPAWPELDPVHLSHLTALPALEKLCFYGVPAMTKEALASLTASLPDCEIVVL